MHAALAELDAVDPRSLTDDALHGVVIELEMAAAQAAGVRARFVAEWEARRVWADDGSKAAWGRLARECQLSETTAKTEVARAKKLRSMPVTTAELAAGRLSLDQADLLRSANQPDIAVLFERDEQLLVTELQKLRYSSGRRFVDYWIDGAYTEADKERSRPDPAGRRLSAARSFDGHINLSGWLDPIHGTEFLEELQAIEQQFFYADRAAVGDGVLSRTPAQRRHDALIEMARHSRAARHGRFHKPDPLLTVHVGMGTLYRMCELADGTVVSPHQVFGLLNDADIERIVFASPSRVIDVGVRQRFFTGATRRAIEVRDRHCQHPSSCDVPAERCEINHKIPYTHGGLTTQSNGECQCRTHNLELWNRDHQRPPPEADDSS